MIKVGKPFAEEQRLGEVSVVARCAPVQQDRDILQETPKARAAPPNPTNNPPDPGAACSRAYLYERPSST